VITVYKGLWGSWRDWHPAGLCNKSSCSLFVGAKFRFEAELVNGDNTALNGIAMFPKVYKLPFKHMRANRID
jgi:hypothetical protein